MAVLRAPARSVTAVDVIDSGDAPPEGHPPARRRRAGFAADRSGSLMPPLALGMVALLTTMAAAVEFGVLAAKRSNLQAAVDNAVLVGATTGDTTWETKATAAFNANVTTPDVDTIAVNFSKASDGTVTGSASRTVTAMFGGLLGSPSYPVAASATAKGSAAKTCILLKGTGSQALLVNGGANVIAPDCEIHVASTASSAAVFNSGTSINAKKICIAGTSIIDNGGSHPNLSTGCTPATDTYAGALPAPPSTVCTNNGGNWNGGTVTLNPGVYCGWYNLNNAPTVTFNPGVYVIKNGGVNVNGGTWQGSGVTFYFDDTSIIQFNSGVTTNLTAPTSGTYAGLLFYEKAGLSTSNFVLNNSPGHALTGLMWLPSRNVTLNSGANATVDKTTMVFNTLILNQMSWSVAPDSTALNGGSGGGAAYLSR